MCLHMRRPHALPFLAQRATDTLTAECIMLRLTCNLELDTPTKDGAARALLPSCDREALNIVQDLAPCRPLAGWRVL